MTIQPEPKPKTIIPDKGKVYHTFTLDSDMEKSKQFFISIYNQEPQTIGQYLNLLWLGPVPERYPE